MRSAPAATAALPLAVVLLTAVTLPGCAPQLRALPRTDSQEEKAVRLDHGYALLYDLLGNEAKVAEILAIKSASAPTTALLKDISRTAADAVATIGRMQSDVPSISLKVTGLPLLETDARNRIANAQTAELLLALGSFELKILLTQQNACQYAWALASSLAAVDPNASRAGAMSQIAAEFDELAKRVSQRLCVTPDAEPAGKGGRKSGADAGSLDAPASMSASVPVSPLPCRRARLSSSSMLDSRAGSIDVRCGTGEIDVTARPSESDHLIAHVGIGRTVHQPSRSPAGTAKRSPESASSRATSNRRQVSGPICWSHSKGPLGWLVPYLSAVSMSALLATPRWWASVAWTISAARIRARMYRCVASPPAAPAAAAKTATASPSAVSEGGGRDSMATAGLDLAPCS